VQVKVRYVSLLILANPGESIERPISLADQARDLGGKSGDYA
jgi:hypothetical protein